MRLYDCRIVLYIRSDPTTRVVPKSATAIISLLVARSIIAVARRSTLHPTEGRKLQLPARTPVLTIVVADRMLVPRAECCTHRGAVHRGVVPRSVGASLAVRAAIGDEGAVLRRERHGCGHHISAV
jgi:hypothetical protein